MKRILIQIVLILGAWACLSCTPGEIGGDFQDVQFQPADGTLILTDSTQPVLVEENAVYFEPNMPGIEQIKPGIVIVGNAGGGFMRRIESVDSGSNRVKANTSPAAMTDAFQNMRVTIRKHFTEDDLVQTTSSSLTQALSTQQNALSASLPSLNPSITFRTDVIEVAGKVSVDPELFLDWEIKNGKFTYLEFSVTTNIRSTGTIKAQLKFDGSTKEVSGTIPDRVFGDLMFTPIPVGPIVVVIPEVQLVGGFSYRVSSTVGFSYNTSITATAGIKYENGNYKPYSSKSISGNASGEAPDLGIYSKLYLGPKFILKVNGALGPYVFPRAYLTGEAKVSTDADKRICLGAYTGIEAALGFNFSIFSLTLADYQHPALIPVTQATILSTCKANTPPAITSVIASPNVLKPNESTTLLVSASDVNGDVLTYQWRGTGNYASNDITKSSNQWSSEQVGTHELTVLVDDGVPEHSVEAKVSIVVTDNPNGQCPYVSCEGQCCAQNDVCDVFAKRCTCVPKTCVQLIKECNSWNDGCGTMIDCGSCPGDEACTNGICTCVPRTCEQIGKVCGIWDNGCGHDMNCGGCGDQQCNADGSQCIEVACKAGFQQCGEGSECCSGNCCTCNCGNFCMHEGGTSCWYDACKDMCSDTCTPNCANKECGPDGCGGSCGSCPAGKKCNSSGRCQCAPKTCSQLGKVCGIWDDGCGHDLNCGGCGSEEQCNASGTQCVAVQCKAGYQQCSASSECCSDNCCTCSCGHFCMTVGGSSCYYNACKDMCP